MATKKYISLDKLSLYDGKIKAYLANADATTLSSAKSYADQVASEVELQAKHYADTEVAKANSAAEAAQSDVDNLETYVGTIPSDYTEETVIAYINKKAEETLSSAQGGSSETAASVLAALNSYKSENDPKVTAAQTSANNAQSYAEGVAADLATETTNRTNADTALGNRISTLEGQITGLSGAMHFVGVKDAVPTDVSGYNSGDVIAVGEKEYVFNGTAFVEFGDVSAVSSRISDVENDMDDVNNRISTEEAARAKSDSDTLSSAKSYADQVASEAELQAKHYADDLNTAMDTRVTTLENDSHTHSNKTVLDGITSTKVSAWDSAATNSHTHTNKTVLDGITSTKVAAWDAAESNAKSYADNLNTAMSTRVTTVETWQSEMIEASEAEITALFA